MRNEWLTPEQLSEEKNVPVRTLAQWRYLGVGPAYVKWGKHVRYSRADVDAYDAANRVTTGGGSAA